MSHHAFRSGRLARLCAPLVTAAVAGCASPHPPPATQSADGSPAGGGGRTIVVRMTDSLTFAPAELTVAVGDTIEWVNVGVVPHTVTADPAASANPDHVRLPEGAEPFDSGLLEAGQTHRQVVQASGEYVYFCVLHAAAPMVGRLTVR